MKSRYLCNCFRLLPCLLCFLFWKWLILREGTVFIRGKCGEDYALSFKWWMLPGKSSSFFFGTRNSEVIVRFAGNILGLNSSFTRTMAHSWIHAGYNFYFAFLFISELWLLNLNIIASFWMNCTQCIKVFFFYSQEISALVFFPGKNILSIFIKKINKYIAVTIWN